MTQDSGKKGIESSLAKVWRGISRTMIGFSLVAVVCLIIAAASYGATEYFGVYLPPIIMAGTVLLIAILLFLFYMIGEIFV